MVIFSHKKFLSSSQNEPSESSHEKIKKREPHPLLVSLTLAIWFLRGWCSLFDTLGLSKKLFLSPFDGYVDRCA